MTLAVYAGSFDPITNGHLSVVARAAPLFDRLIVLVAVNPIKRPLFAIEERLSMIRESCLAWPNVTADSTRGYVADFAAARGAGFLVRGIRDAHDLPTEFWLADLNRRLAPGIETVFLPALSEFSTVSSSRLKKLAAEGAELTGLCPPAVLPRLREQFPLEVSHAWI